MFAAIDLGSNSFRMQIGQHDGVAIRVIKSMRDPIRLAAGLDSDGYLSEAAIQSAITSLKGFNRILRNYSLDAVRVVATNTFRIAKNVALFLPLAEKAIGYPIEIISGEEEGRLIYMGVASLLAVSNGTAHEKRLVIDIGGGSTELILGDGHSIERVESFGVGTVGQSLTFFPAGHIDAACYDAAILSARSRFEDAAPPYLPQHWQNAYGSSGTVRAIYDVISKNNLGNGDLSYDSLVALKSRFIEFGHVEKIIMPGLNPDRAGTIIGGLAILIALVQELEIPALQPIAAGLRMGVMWDLYLRSTRRDRREQAVREFSQHFHVDSIRANRVADDAVVLFRQLKPESDALEKYLYWSALLHEAGMAVSQTNYHKHAAYLIENADLPGFTTREQRTMSRLALSQKGNLRKVSEALIDADFAKAVLALRLAIMFMHCRLKIDFSQLRLKMKNKIECEMKQDRIADHPTLSFWLEKEQAWWKEVGVEFVVRGN